MVEYIRRYLGDSEVYATGTEITRASETPNELCDYIRRYLGDPIA